MHRWLLSVCLLVPQGAWAWPDAGQWAPVTLDGLTVQDVSEETHVADVVGDETDNVLAWYANDENVWFRVRVRTSSFATDTDVVGVGLRSGTSSPQVLVWENGGGRAGTWDSSCEWGTTAVTWDASTYSVRSEDGTDGFTTVDLQVELSTFTSWVGGETESFEVIGFHGGISALDEWVLDFAGVDESDAAWQCSDAWSDASSLDEDADGLHRFAELALGGDPTDADTDDDGVMDGLEDVSDLDGDGQIGLLDCDSDGDGLTDGTEMGVVAPLEDTDLDTVNEEASGPVERLCFVADADPGTQTDPLNADTDGGGLADGYEDWNLNGAVDEREVDPNGPDDDADRDGDTIADAIEGKESDFDDDGYKDYKDADADGDDIPDAIEFLYDTDEDGDFDYLDRDSDGDGLSDRYEGMADTDNDGLMNFRDTDSDNDGISDGTDGIGDDDCDGIQNYLDPFNPDNPDENCNDKAPGTDTENFSPETWDRSTSHRDGRLGGGCVTAPSRASGMLAFISFVVVVLARRLKWGWGLIFCLFPGVVQAQSTSVNAQRFVPSVSDGRWVRLRPGRMLPDGSLILAMNTDYARNPLVFRGLNESTKTTPLLQNVVTSHLVGGFTAGIFPLGGAFQVGVQMPVVWHSDGGLGEAGTVLGDFAFSAGWGWQRDKDLAMAVWVDGAIPTGEYTSGLGAGYPQFGGGYSIEWRSGRLEALGNLGFQSGTPAESYDLRVGPAVTWGTGVGVAVTPLLRLGIEVDGEIWLLNPLIGEDAQPGAVPMEWMFTAGLQPTEHWRVLLGAGTRIGSGVGTPDVRTMLALHWSPRFYRPELNPAKRDSDGDGIVDLKDNCVEQPEDINGVRDTDGCPDGDGLVMVHFEIVDAGGRLVAGSRVDLLEGDTLGTWLAADGTVGRALHPGRYEIRAEAEGFLPVTMDISVPAGDRHGIRLTLIAPQGKGQVVLRLVDSQGLPLPDAQVRVLGTDLEMTSSRDGLIQFELPAGGYEVVITAANGSVVNRPLQLDPGASADMTVAVTGVTQPNAAQMVQITNKVFFGLKKTELTVASYQALDALVKTLSEHPEIKKVRINGHADAGPERSYAQQLSEKRASVIYEYLLNAGIDPQRLVTKGYGYALPLQMGGTDAVMQTNRRVEFSILEYGEVE